MIPVVLDSCSWIWLASDRKRLSVRAKATIEEARRHRMAYLSVFSCWEVAKLVQKGKLAFQIPVDQWIARALRLEGIVLHDLTPQICVQSTELPGAFHGDPADQIIVATARVLGAAVVTSDQKMRTYEHVTSIW